MFRSSSRLRHLANNGFTHVSRQQTSRRLVLRRWLATSKGRSTLAVASQPRFNEIGVQHLSDHVFNQIFPNGCKPPPKELVKLSKEHLRRHDLLGKTTDNSDPIAFDLPALQGRTLDEHFFRLGNDCAEPYLTLAKDFVQVELPKKPSSWVRRSGWTKYYPDGRTEAVEAPDDVMLCFDTETLYKESPFSVMACAASPSAWFVWLSPWLLGESKCDRHLIPLGDPAKARIIVGHNIGYDRARVLEEYNLEQSRNAFLDTMSFHVAVNGMCSRQRPTWMKHKKERELREKVAAETPDHDLAELLSRHGPNEEEEELWVERSSINSLRDVAKFHLDVSLDKTVRDDFGTLDRDGVLAKLDELLDYCATDVSITHRIYQIVFPNFLTVCPHPVSFAALRHLSSVILPVNRSWDEYIAGAEAKYRELSDAVHERLVGLTEKALALKDDAAQWEEDPWLKQLDWSGQEIRMVKGKRKGDPERPAARQKKPGMPRWYKDLFAKNDSPMNITVRTRIAPLLLKMSWDGHPLFWSDKYGWTFRVPKDQAATYTAKQMIECEFEEGDPVLRDDHDHAYIKLPHKDGPTARCANVLAKGYLAFFENGILSSAYSYAKEALEMNASCSYWISARDRITSQLVVYENDLSQSQTKGKGKKGRKKLKGNENGFILPQIIPMGTITRRAVENTWLTASNAKKNRVGSELKAMIKAPDGYCFVGADVDSQELWIASLVGDATFKLHGGNAVGFMTLEGTKAAGTDLHSRTAAILGISRNDAKVFNYGRIYGAGLKFAATLLRQFNPSLTEKETTDTATKLYANTKGTKTNRKALYQRPFWRGGTESLVFNKLEEFAEQERPRTPVLGAGITEALMARYISKGGYLTSRINWAIQSSGVDYLHLLIVSMNYLISRYGIDARLAITVHDEIRYLVKAKDRYRAALALQVANVWTRAMFAQQVGIDDLPQSCAYFSAVDIDHVLRKEVDMECVTPSHPTPIPPGESLDIKGILDKGNEAKLTRIAAAEAEDALNLRRVEYVPRKAVMESMRETSGDSLAFIKAQVANEFELRDLIKSAKPAAIKDKNYTKYKKSSQQPLMRQPYPHLVPKETLSVTEVMESTFRRGSNELNRWPWSNNNAAKGPRPASRI
ncbi:DNA polymerase gamma [Ophiocordyceps camponoti-floridani]|uniref:DNA-directed DNA polymerase n=1 Tax=Ophiocordyceps camponoti-floridani TaxID=2030778 RepID=A0A8H4Q9I2_9HYPO|nr:DNA polymerase gamma [Ophiocordyceps camponoti-floridani]